MDQQLRMDLQAVSSIKLIGAPRTVVLDQEALFDRAGSVTASLDAKLAVLGMPVVVIADDPLSVRCALPGVRDLSIVKTMPAEVEGAAVAVLGRAHQPLTDCYAWFVGSGAPPAWMHPTDGQGAAITEAILASFGTGLVQERAHAAFRAAGCGNPMPASYQYDLPRILEGVTRAVTPAISLVGRCSELREAYSRRSARRNRALLYEAYEAIVTACASNGAIAAAAPPRTPEDPDYWFFWQRDAGQVAVAMAAVARRFRDTALSKTATDGLRGYLQFVTALPRHRPTQSGDLAVSRHTIDGAPIRQYGNPQTDGPAHTALAVMTALSEPTAAYPIVKPYLDFLTTPEGLGPTFDPWEFSVGEIFNPLNLARRALRAGATVARAVGEQAAARAYDATVSDLRQRLDGFYDNDRGYIVCGRELVIPWMGTLSQLDASVIGSVLTAYDVTDDYMNVDDPRIRDTMRALEDHFARRWPVNSAWRAAGNAGMGVGRFPEDTNDGAGSTGGNPWVFVTLWAAQFYLRTIQRRAYLGTDADLPDNLCLAKARGYLDFVIAHLPASALSEQIDGFSGRPRGARRLAWAHAELVNTLLLLDDVRTVRWPPGVDPSASSCNSNA
ncbi:MAG: glycoside hydrolase family 15 protein [Egibacteraceae bacterium]